MRSALLTCLWCFLFCAIDVAARRPTFELENYSHPDTKYLSIYYNIYNASLLNSTLVLILPLNDRVLNLPLMNCSSSKLSITAFLHDRKSDHRQIAVELIKQGPRDIKCWAVRLSTLRSLLILHPLRNLFGHVFTKPAEEKDSWSAFSTRETQTRLGNK